MHQHSRPSNQWYRFFCTSRIGLGPFRQKAPFKFVGIDPSTTSTCNDTCSFETGAKFPVRNVFLRRWSSVPAYKYGEREFERTNSKETTIHNIMKENYWQHLNTPYLATRLEIDPADAKTIVVLVDHDDSFVVVFLSALHCCSCRYHRFSLSFGADWTKAKRGSHQVDRNRNDS